MVILVLTMAASYPSTNEGCNVWFFIDSFARHARGVCSMNARLIVRNSGPAHGW